MIRSATPKPEHVSNHDFKRLCDALVVAILALDRLKDSEALEQIEDIIEGRARLERMVVAVDSGG